MVITDKQLGLMLDDMTIIVDTREQKNAHILLWLTENKIPYAIGKVDTGDYTYELPNFKEFGLDRKVLVEKKKDLNEFTSNLSSDRARLEREFGRVVDEDMHLLIEDATFKKLLNGSYRSNLNPQSVIATLFSWSHRYKFQTWFVGKEESPKVIYDLLKYGLRNRILEMRD